MKLFRLIYIGEDLPFGRLLSGLAKSYKISYQLLPPLQIDHLKDCENALLIIDTQSIPADEALPGYSTAANLGAPLVILAVSEADLKTFTLPPQICQANANILIKTQDQNILNKQVGFYLDYLCALAPKPEKPHDEVIQKNQKLSQQLVHLQERLNQTDSDLKIQEKVIEKINEITQLSRQINCLDLAAIAGVCIEKIPRLIDARFASLYAYDPGKNTLQLLRHNHPFAIAESVNIAENSQVPMALAVRRKKLLFIRDIAQWQQSTEYPISCMYACNYKTNSCIIAPLLSGENVAGVINLADKIDGDCFDNAVDLPPIQLLCEIIGSAMSNIELYNEVQKRARTDSMTNLANHRTFYNELEKEVHRSQRYGGSLSLIMIDLDSLKQINDIHGHRAGDAALIHVAHKISRCIRDTDLACRYGGDEFAIILPNTSLSDAMIVAQRLMDSVAAETVKTDDFMLRISISLGMSQYRQGFSIEDFMNDADTALLKAKEKGKNRIYISE